MKGRGMCQAAIVNKNKDGVSASCVQAEYDKIVVKEYELMEVGEEKQRCCGSKLCEG
jgi:hypothetical protein